MSRVGVAHNFAPKFDYDTRTTTGAKYFPRTVFVPLLEEYHRHILKSNYERNAKLKRDEKLHYVCIQKRIYQRQRVCFVVWCEQVKKPRFSVLDRNYERFELDELTNAEYTTLNFASIKMTYTNLRMHFSCQTSSWRMTVWLSKLFLLCVSTSKDFHFARRPVPEICLLTNHKIDWIYNRWNRLLTTNNHNLLSPANLMLYADALDQSGAALDNCWVSWMELFGQCVGQVSIKEVSTMDTSGCLP